jgi:hypothetical protein
LAAATRRPSGHPVAALTAALHLSPAPNKTAPLPLAVALFWLCLNLLAFHEPSRGWPLLSLLYEPVIFVLRSRRDLAAVVGALWAAHVVEAGYAAVLCGGAALPGRQVAGWAMVTGVMGFGVLPGLKRELAGAGAAHLREVRRALGSGG